MTCPDTASDDKETDYVVALSPPGGGNWSRLQPNKRRAHLVDSPSNDSIRISYSPVPSAPSRLVRQQVQYDCQCLPLFPGFTLYSLRPTPGASRIRKLIISFLVVTSLIITRCGVGSSTGHGRPLEAAVRAAPGGSDPLRHRPADPLPHARHQLVLSGHRAGDGPGGVRRDRLRHCVHGRLHLPAEVITPPPSLH